ncbi:MAG: hypothetical protein IPJ94_27955 [Chloroflexi bacterium]|nr:hypothetical protein [Chloroflexota bacterium]
MEGHNEGIIVSGGSFSANQVVVGENSKAVQINEKVLDTRSDSEISSFFQSNKYYPLYEKLTTYFNDEDIRTLSFFLGIDYDDFQSSGKANKVRELIMYCVRTGYLEQLKQKCRELRPNLEWDMP